MDKLTNERAFQIFLKMVGDKPPPIMFNEREQKHESPDAQRLATHALVYALAFKDAAPDT